MIKVKRDEVEKIFLISRGGGDFRGDSDLVGSWARDLVSVSSTMPDGYSELVFDLVED